MPYDEDLANKARELIALTRENVEEKKMFGGLCFMVNDKMLIGVVQDRLMVRIDPVIYDDLIAEGECRPMDFTGKTMKSFVFVESEFLKTKSNFEHWIDLAMQYNKIVKPTKKKRSGL